MPPADRAQICVDISKRSFILPINGFAVPFHINTLKNVVKQEEGEYTVLRFMFIAPGQIVGKKEDTPFEDPNATFIRGLTFRNTDSDHMSDVYKQITDLKKAIIKREKDKAELADVVDQDDLREVKQGKRPIKMLDISLRPNFDGKRQAGDVEIHQNGIRYQSSLKSDHRVGGSRPTQRAQDGGLTASGTCRHPVQQHQAPALPALRPGTHRRPPHQAQVAHHGRPEEDVGRPVLPRGLGGGL